MNSAQLIAKFPSKVATLTGILKEFNAKSLEKSYRVIEERKPFLNIIQNAVCRPNHSRLVAVGSFVNKLDYNEKSDIDLAFFTNNMSFLEDFHTNFEFQKFLMISISDLIKNLHVENSSLKVSEPITIVRKTKIPLIIFKFEQGISLDIQFTHTNFQTIRNTNYIRYCTMADERFSQLFQWLKNVFVSMGVKKSAKGLFSSFHMLALVAHFLQTNTNHSSVLPLLSKSHKHLVGADLPIENVIDMLDEPLTPLKDWQSKNTKSIGELIVEMVEYYVKFDAINNRICLDEHKAMPKLQFTNALDIYDSYSRMSITRSNILADLLITSFTFLQMKMENGELFDSLDYKNLGEEFQEYCANKPWLEALKDDSDATTTTINHDTIMDDDGGENFDVDDEIPPMKKKCDLENEQVENEIPRPMQMKN